MPTEKLWKYLATREETHVGGELVEVSLRLIPTDSVVHLVDGEDYFTVYTRVSQFGEDE